MTVGAPAPEARSSLARRAWLALVVGIAGVYVALGVDRPWDFETYYYAAAAWKSGRNPYLLESLSAVAGKTVHLPFLYPPVTLLGFAPFTVLPPASAAILWLGLKVFLVMWLLRSWRRDFLGSAAWSLLIPAALLGFDLALLWDLRTGNAALIEETLLWGAFSAYVRGRPRIFACLVAAAAVFKLYPIVFLGLLLVPPATPRDGVRRVGLGLAVFLALVAVPTPLTGAWLKALAGPLAAGRRVGEVNPSALGLIDWGLIASGASKGTGWLGGGIFAAFAALVLAVGRRGLKRAWTSESPREVVLAALLLWLVLAPRLIVYSCVMAVVPILASIRSLLVSSRARVAALGLVFLPGALRLLPGNYPPPVSIASFAVILWMWLAYARPVGGRLGEPPAVVGHGGEG